MEVIMKTRWVFLLVISAFFCSVSGAADEVRFEKVVLDKTFRAEGVAVGDINHDGRLDIFVGDVWYEASDWKMHELRPVGQYDGTTGYSNCFANFAQDVNGDGWIDSIVIGLPDGPCLWYENPKNKSGHWKERMVAKSACNETPIFVNLLGDGKPVPVFAVRPKGQMAWFSVPKDLDALWDMHIIAAGPNAPGTEKYSHGLGAGDVNGDGRCDVLIKDGWWQAPRSRTRENWKFHPAKLGPDCADLLVYDIDNDGDGDVITSSAHNYGIWWFEQIPGTDGPQFEQHEISKEFSQPHAIRLVDVNGDGIEDLVTGKRHFAHMGKDPGGKDPALLYWFELSRGENGDIKYIPHKIDDDSGVGTQFEIADMNGDGKPDIVTSNKKGVYVFMQLP